MCVCECVCVCVCVCVCMLHACGGVYVGPGAVSQWKVL